MKILIILFDNFKSSQIKEKIKSEGKKKRTDQLIHNYRSLSYLKIFELIIQITIDYKILSDTFYSFVFFRARRLLFCHNIIVL